ncbi:MAG: butyryl-CoA dehydrogenase [Micromonosporaceae bacterium]|nr:butyryl-CoA dehydrogenase [Micromonosporaceae bacterium]
MDFQLDPAHLEWKARAKEFAEKHVAPVALKLDIDAQFDRDLWNAMADFGMAGFIIPTEYGGRGHDTIASCLMYEGFGAGGAPFGVATWTHPHVNDCAMGIVEHGSEELKRRILPKMASGEYIGSFALSEWGAGSDAAAIATTAVRDGDHYVLNGTKTWITNGPICDVALVVAYTDPERRPRDGMTCFIVESRMPGFGKGRNLTDSRLGERPNQNGELVFTDCRVPVGNRLGAEGSGNQVMRDVLFWERAGVLGNVVGMMEFLIERSVYYARERSTFGKPLAERQAIVHKLADMKLRTEATRLFVYKCAAGKNDGSITTMDTSLAKLAVAENFIQVALDAVQIHGGRGYLREYEIERYLRDAKLFNIAGGSDEMMRDMIGSRVIRDTPAFDGPYVRECGAHR